MRLMKRLGGALDWLLLALGFAGGSKFLAQQFEPPLRPTFRGSRRVVRQPGGGAREVARRRRQIERGTLKCSVAT